MGCVPSPGAALLREPTGPSSSLAPALVLKRAQGQRRAPVEGKVDAGGCSEQVEDPASLTQPCPVLLLGRAEGAVDAPGAPSATLWGGLRVVGHQGQQRAGPHF